MRGFPLLNLLLALLLSGLVVLPLVHRATRVPDPVEAPARDETGPKTKGTPAHVSLRFVHPPQAVRLKSGDVILHEWKVSSPALLLEDSISLPLHDGRAEFTVQIQWPAGTPEPFAELRIEPDGLPARAANIWGSGESADELITLTWKGETP